MDKHVCGLCGETYCSVFNFLKHKLVHVSRKAGIGCEICQLSFSRQGPLQDHYRRKHQINLAQKTTITQNGKNLQDQNPAGKLPTPCVKENLLLNEGASGVVKNVRVTKFNNVLPKGKLIVKSIFDNQKNNSNQVKVVDETTLRNDRHESPHTTCDEFIIAGSISGSSGTVIDAQCNNGVPDTSHTGMCIYPGDNIAVRNYGIDYVGVSEEVVNSNNESSEHDADIEDHGVRFTDPKVDWCVESHPNITMQLNPNIIVVSNPNITMVSNSHITAESNPNTITEPNLNISAVSNPNIVEEFNPDSMASDEGIIDYATVCESSQSIKNRNGKSVSLSETDTSLMTERHRKETKGNTSILQTNIENNIYDNKQVHCFDVNTLPNVETLNHTKDNEQHGRLYPKRMNVSTTRIVRKRKALTPIEGKIPQELNMSDFYFMKITSQSGTSTSRCSGRDLFQCILCKKIMRWRSDLCRHMRDSHIDELNSGEALSVDKHQGDLEDQEGTMMKMTEYIDLETLRKPGKRKRGIETQDLPGDFPCETCGKVFHRLRNLRFHRHVHETGNEIMCSICSKLLKSKASFERHLKTHQEREAYKCNQCDFESTVNIAIHKHRQIHNSNSYLCDICGRAYKDKSTLTKHKNVHDMSRPFACTHPGCTWRFKTQVMCNAHIRSHSTKRTFECTTCGYVFSQKHHLQRHEKMIHNIVHKTKPGLHAYNWTMDGDNMDGDNESEIQTDSKEANSLEVSHEVNLIINEDNMSGVMSTEHFDLESALQSGQIVIANDDGTSINYEMSDIGSNVVYQTLLHDGVEQQFETHTVCIPPNDTGDVSFHEVDSVQTEVEIEQS